MIFKLCLMASPRLAAPAALIQYLRLVEPGEAVSDAGPDAPMRWRLLVADGAAGLSRCGPANGVGFRYLRGS
jgi:hypothetical protein